MFDTILSQANNPHFVIGALQNAVNQDVPVIAGIIEGGVKDGSLQHPSPNCVQKFFTAFEFLGKPYIVWLQFGGNPKAPHLFAIRYAPAWIGHS